MRTVLFSTLILVSFLASAKIEFLYGGEKGPTYVDSVDYKATLHITQTMPGQVTVTPTPPLKDANGNVIPNYYVIRKQKADGTLETSQEMTTEYNCENAKLADPTIVFCKGYAALELNITEPTVGTEGAPAPAVVNVDLSTPEFKALLAQASPEDEYVIIKDPQTNVGLISSLKEKTFCSLAKKRVSLEGPWNKEDFPLSHIYTSDTTEPGFYIADHTQYMFDAKKGSWCYRFFPNLTQTEPVCRKSFNDFTFRVDFLYEKSNTRVNRGVVKLSIDENGNPVAYLGTARDKPALSSAAESSVAINNVELDPTKPIMKINILKNDKKTPIVRFQGFSKMGGAAGRALTISPNYSMGNEFNSNFSCDSSTCLSPVDSFMNATERASPNSCSMNKNPLDLNSQRQNGICYSCNGVTPGNCGPDKVLMTQSIFRTQAQKIPACLKSEGPPVAVEPGAGLTETLQ